MNSSAKPESGPECSVPATGCAGTKWTPAGRCGAMSLHDGALDRADVGDDRARLEVRRDLLRHRAAGADGDAEDDEVGVLHRFRIGLEHAIDDAELGDARAGLVRARGGDDLAGQALRRAARAIEPPIRPKPISAMRLNRAWRPRDAHFAP